MPRAPDGSLHGHVHWRLFQIRATRPAAQVSMATTTDCRRAAVPADRAAGTPLPGDPSRRRDDRALQPAAAGRHRDSLRSTIRFRSGSPDRPGRPLPAASAETPSTAARSRRAPRRTSTAVPAARSTSAAAACSRRATRALAARIPDHIAGAADGMQQRRVIAAIDRLAQPADVHVDQIGLRIEVQVPYGL